MEKKEAIRQAAITVIAQRGFHEAVIDMIAAEARVSVGTIYNYFKSKSEILSYIFEVEYNKRLAFFEQVQENSNLQALEKIDRILRYHIDQMKGNPNLVAIIIREKNLPCVCHQSGVVQLRGLPGLPAKVLEAGMKEGISQHHCFDRGQLP